MLNIVSRRRYLSQYDQRNQRKECREKHIAGRMVMVLERPETLVYYLDCLLLEEPEQAARQIESKRNVTAAEWKSDENETRRNGEIMAQFC